MKNHPTSRVVKWLKVSAIYRYQVEAERSHAKIPFFDVLLPEAENESSMKSVMYKKENFIFCLIIIKKASVYELLSWMSCVYYKWPINESRYFWVR